MKGHNTLWLLIQLFLLLTVSAFSQRTGINTSSPHATAILDMVSSNKGLLIPRMTSAQRNAIPLPVTGLMIYQLNDDPGFYYYNAGWKKVAPNTTVLSDIDNDTKIQVEESPDEDMIRIDLAGFERMVLSRNASNISRISLPGNNRNVLVGDLAGNSITTGTGNTATGTETLSLTSTGNYNTAIGNEALRNNTDNENTAAGSNALFTNTTGTGNTAIGSFALELNTSGDSITAMGISALRVSLSSRTVAAGANALKAMTTGLDNTVIGCYAADLFVSGNYNSVIGCDAMAAQTSGNGNTVLGFSAGDGTSNADYNTVFGARALGNNTGGDFNTALGSGALFTSSGSSNTAAGLRALYSATSATNSTALGMFSLYSMTLATGNTGAGVYSLQANTGSNNTGVGYNALNVSSSSSSRNVAFGSYAFDSSSSSRSDCVALGYKADMVNSSIIHGIAIGAFALSGGNNIVTLGSIQGTNGATQTAQVGIGTSSPHNSAILELKSNERGFLLPRMSGGLRQGLILPPAGLMVFDTDTNSPWYFNGTTWVNLEIPLTSLGAMTGETLVFDGNDWVPGFPVAISDLDGDTWASLENTPDADELRIQLGGIVDEVRFVMRENSNGHLLIELPGNERCVYMGHGFTDIDDEHAGNTVIGYNTMTLADGDENVVVGKNASTNAMTVDHNVSIGAHSSASATGGSNNVTVGSQALSGSNADISGNVCIGSEAGSNLGLINSEEGVDNCLAVGYKAQVGEYSNRSIAIGARAYCANSDCMVLGSVEGVNGATESVEVGIGITAPTCPLHILHNSTSSSPHILLEDAGDAAGEIWFKNDLTSDPWKIWGEPAATNANATLKMFFNGVRLELKGNGNAVLDGSLMQNSDRRLKKDIIQFTNVLPSLSDIHGYRYHWISKKRSQDEQIGLIAQEVSSVFPQLVKKDDEGYLALNYPAMTAVLMEALKEQHARQKQIETKQKEQHERIKSLQKELDAVMQRNESIILQSATVKSDK